MKFYFIHVYIVVDEIFSFKNKWNVLKFDQVILGFF